MAASCSFQAPLVGSADDVDGATVQQCAAPAASLSLRSLRIVNGPGLNGQLFGSWPQAERQSFDMAAAPWKIVEDGSSYDDSASLTVRSMHTANTVYFGVEVSDPTIVEDDDSAVDPETEDVIFLFIDSNGDRAGAFGPDDHWIAIDVAGNTDDYGSAPAPVGVGTSSDTSSWTAEIGIAKSELGIDTMATTVGFNIAVVDQDNLGSAGRDAVGLWDYPDASACTSACAPQQRAPWCDTTMFGLLEFLP